MFRIQNLLLILIFASCQRYLDLKPDKKMLIPSMLNDVEAMLDNVSQMNLGSSGLSEIGSDNYYLPQTTYNSLSLDEYRASYTWSLLPVNKLHWVNPYSTVYGANVALEALRKIETADLSKKRELEGRAIFYRAHVLFNLLQVFSKQYDEKQSAFDLGVPLVESPDINTVYKRSNVAKCYEFIISDLEKSIGYLKNDREFYPTRPTVLAAEALLANVYLQLKDYEKAGYYSDRVLGRYNEVLDYHKIAVKRFPFNPYNQEVIFYSRMFCQTNLMASNARVIDDLFNLYREDDLRKSLFFSQNVDGSYSFTGNYSAIDNNTQFNGITVPEMMLVSAEVAIRRDDLIEGRRMLRQLASFRYKSSYFEGNLDVDKKNLLKICLEERRRELAFRGRRWLDLRRCDKEELQISAITRDLDKPYELSVNALIGFTYHIPVEVVEMGNIEQN